METSILFLGGDISQFDHSKKELNKRLSGLISNGPRIRTDIAAQLFLSDKSEGGFSENTYASTLPEGYDKFKYDGYLNTAVMEDIKRTSIYAEEIRRGLTRDLKKRNPNLSDEQISERVNKQVDNYINITEGDGQGYITFDAYRLLKKAQNKWSVPQENLYKKIVAGEEINAADALDAFPVYKLQNFGFVEDTVLPVLAMHKFALMPLIPGVIKDKELENLHKQMLKNNVQYATFASGSKIGGVSSTTDGKVDQIFEEGGKKLKKDIVFTKNRIHGAYIKEAASVPSKLKGKVIFSTQLRKLVLEGLKEYGVAVSPLAQELTDTYEGLVNFYSDLLKKDLENEIGYRKDANGTYIGNPAKFLKLIQINLKAKDYPKHLIESLKVNSDGTLNYDLSYFIDSKSIESVVMSIVNTKLIKQKINGEALVQVASTMWNSSAEEELAIKFDKLTPEENEAARKKYLGTNTLPFYTVGPDGKTLPMKVAIALQGNFNNLLNLKHNDGQAIGTRKRLNQMIKNEEWLGKGDNRKSITLDAVRIPVQGLNSMEFMEVYEFLDPAAHTMIILPTEIVAKSGGDFDVDKLTTFFPNIDKDGNYIKSNILNANFFAEIARLESEGKSVSSVISLQKKAVENEMIQAIKAILEIEDNYAALVTPNSTEILKDEADMLEEFVSSRDIYAKVNGDPANTITKEGKVKKVISATSVLEPLFNASVHRANLEGKDVLSLAANDNTFNTLLTSIGAKMPLKYKASEWNKSRNRYVEFGNPIYDMRLFLPHNKINGHISLSTISTEDALYKIADVISQGMNGWLDVGKDAWIFYIQGNLETSPVLLYLVKAGVPVKDAIYFVSNPLIREYTERQTLGKGVYAGPTGMGSKESVMVPYESAVDIFDKYNNQFISDTLSKIPTGKTLTIGVTEEDPFGRPIIVEQELTKESVLENLYSLNIAYITDGETRIFQEVKPSTAKIYDSSDFLSKIPGVLKNGNFDRKEMLDIIQERGELKGKNLETSFAILAHFIEIEKQIKGLAALKRSAKFDAKTLRSPQELVLKNFNIDLLFDNSKVDPETARKLLKESIISSFGDQSIIEEIFMPMMPLKNGDKINTFISNVIGGYSETQKSRINEIFKAYGTSSEAINKFMSAYKDAVNNFIFQNYLSNMIDKKGNIVSVPTEFNKQEVKIDLSLPTDVEIRDGVFIVNSKRIRQDFTEKKYLATDNEVNNYSSREGLEAFTESNDVFPTEESYFKYVLEREYLFNKGLRGTELNKEALMNVFNYASIMLPGKYSFSDQVLEVINKHKKTLSRGYGIIEQIRGYVEKSDLNLLTLSDRDVLTGDTATSYATELKALANPRIQKVADPEENLKISKLFSLFPLMMVYQHGYGQTIAGFELALPTEKVLSKMKAAGALFKNNYDTSKTYNLIFSKLVATKSRFPNYVVTAEQYNQYKPEVPKEVEIDDSALDPENEVTTQSSTSVKPESINNVKEMFLGLKLGTFTFTVGESEYEVEPKKNYEGVVRFNIYKYNNETKLYNPVINPKTKRSLLTEEANNFLKNYLPKDYIDFIIDLSKNSKSKLDEAPSKTRPGKMGTIFNNLIDAYLFQIPVREMVYGEDSAPILLTLDEVNKKVNELYSSELISGIEKYLKPFVKDQLIKDIENIYKEKINNKTQTYLNDLETALKNFETAPTTQPSTSVEYNYNPSNVSEQTREDYKQYVLKQLGKPEIKAKTNAFDFIYPDLTITISKDGSVSYTNVNQKIVDLSKTDSGYDLKFMVGLNKLAEEFVQPSTSVKEGVSEVFESNPELSSIGTAQQYSQYLDTIFPDSKVKDITYHGSHTRFDKFDKSLSGSKTRANINGKGFFFSNSKAIAQGYTQSLDKSNIYNDLTLYWYFKRDLGNKNINNISEKEWLDMIINYFGNDELTPQYLQKQTFEKTKALFEKFKDDEDLNNVQYTDEIDASKYIQDTSVVYPVILDIIDPLVVEGNNRQMLTIVKKETESLKETNDGIVFNNVEDGMSNGARFVANTYTVFESEQIHILGNKKDIEGFKDFVTQSSTTNNIETDEIRLDKLYAEMKYISSLRATPTPSDRKRIKDISNEIASIKEKSISKTEKPTTDQFKYFGSMYTIKLDNGVGVDVEGYKGKPDAKAKLLNAYNENPNVDPQNGREFRQTYTAPVESATPGEYSFTFANGFVIDTPFPLNPEQQSALLNMEDFLNDSEKYNNEIALIGYAGTGKTTIISLFDKYIRSKGGRRPKYSSPTHRANAVTKMNNPNADVQTLHKLFGLQPQLEIDKLGELSLEDIKSKQTNPVRIGMGDLLIIDESSMISDTLYKFIRENKEKLGIKVIYLGDPAQLAPVDKTKKNCIICST
jgi:hypothetical protein